MNQPRFQVRKPTKWPTIRLFFWRGGGVWVISENNILQRDFEGKKLLQGNTWGNKFLHWKKNLSQPLYFRKKILSPESRGKNSYPKPIRPPPPSRPPQKKKWLAPNCLFLSEFKKKWRLRLPEAEIAEFLTNWTEEMQECAKHIALLTLSTFWGVSARKKKHLFVSWNRAKKKAKSTRK